MISSPFHPNLSSSNELIKLITQISFSSYLSTVAKSIIMLQDDINKFI